jgi:solute carrier family 29 (equilibrative nucleoside transporter), member 1/2/3
MTALNIELQSLSNMDRVKRFFGPPQQPYEPIDDRPHEDGDSVEEDFESGQEEQPFSWVEYFIFMLLGVAMLWAWYDNQSFYSILC